MTRIQNTMVTYEFTMSQPFFVQAFERYQNRGKLRPVLFILKIFLGLCLVGLAVFSLKLKEHWPSLVFVAMLLLLILSRKFDAWLIVWRLKKSPYIDQHCRIEFSTEGVRTVTSMSSSQAFWSIFTSADRFQDGFLLKQGPGLFSWLPNHALVSGTVEEAGSLFRAHVSNYRD